MRMADVKLAIRENATGRTFCFLLPNMYSCGQVERGKGEREGGKNVTILIAYVQCNNSIILSLRTIYYIYAVSNGNVGVINSVDLIIIIKV